MLHVFGTLTTRKGLITGEQSNDITLIRNWRHHECSEHNARAKVGRRKHKDVGGSVGYCDRVFNHTPLAGERGEQAAY
jgi:hypothetical protein